MLTCGWACRLEARPGPASARGCRSRLRVSHLGPVDQTAWLSETIVAFAGVGRASTETAIAFAGEKWAFSCVFRLQRCRRFQRLLFRGEHW